MARNIITHNYFNMYAILKQNIRQFSCFGGNQWAGHSKWANIRHIKALKDGQKSQIFVKLARQIRIALQEGGSSNPAINSALQSAIEEATKKNMPQATVKGIIKKQTESAGSSKLSKYILEMKIINKIFVVAIVYTDNLTQIKMNISTLLRKYGGVFSAVRHTFTEKGIIAGAYDNKTTSTSKSFDELCAEFAINCDAEEYEIQRNKNNLCVFICSPDNLERVKYNLVMEKWSIDTSEHIFITNIPVKLQDSEAQKFNTFRTKLKEVDGVEDVYDNFETES